MFFIRDDFTFIYKLQQNLPIADPYGHLLTFFKPIYPLFKLNAYSYYLLGVFLFSISAVFVFHFLRKIGNTKISLFATLLYATGLISLENLIMMELISPIPVLIITTISFLMLFIKFTETGKKKYYLISLLLYIFSLVFFSYRAHLLYSYVFLVDFFFIFFKISIKDLKNGVMKFIVRQLPYVVIFFFWFNNSSKSSELVTSSYYLGLFNTPLRDNIIINFTNLFLQPVQIVAPGFLDISVSEKISIGIGILFVSVILGIYALVKKQRQNAILLFFSLSAIFANLIAYFLFNPDFQIQGISRYNFLNAINFNIYIATIFFLIHKLINNRFVKHAIIGLAVGTFLLFFFASFLYIKDFNKTRSIPAKTFWSQLRQFMPAIPKGALIYVDRKEILPFDPSEFVRVGTLTTEASFASMYQVPIAYLTYTKYFDDVEKKFIDDRSSINSIFAFYLNENKLINITQEVRKGLATPKEITLSKKNFKYNSVEHIVIDCENYSVGLPPVLEINLSVPSFTPVTVTIPIQIQPLDLASIKYPYYQIKGTLLDNDELKNTQKTDVCNSTNELTFKNNTPPDVIQYIRYIKRQEELLQTVEVTGSKTLPEDLVGNLIDDDPRTLWTSDVTDWEKNKKANIIATFPSKIAIKKLFLVPANYQRLPKNLTVSSLSDDKTWRIIQAIDNAVMEENDWYEINLPTTNTKSIQITITDTNTGKYPQIADLYFVEDQWGNINTDFLRAFKENPFLFVPDLRTAYELQSYLINNQKESIFWKRDKDSNFSENNYKKFSIFQDGILHTYPITIPAGGTILENLRLEGFNLPSTVSIIDIQ